MTTPEHSLVGIHVAFALGLHRTVGWRSVVFAALVSNIPDWDGLPMLFDMQRFESGHRVWGHSIASLFLTSILLAWTQIRWDWIGGLVRWGLLQFPALGSLSEKPHDSQPYGIKSLLSFTCIALMSQMLHLICDMVVSGGKGLSSWAIQPFWPFSGAAYDYPLIPWGDVGPTVILMTGIIMVAKRKELVCPISRSTLVILLVYLMARGAF